MTGPQKERPPGRQFTGLFIFARHLGHRRRVAWLGARRESMELDGQMHHPMADSKPKVDARREAARRTADVNSPAATRWDAPGAE